MRRLLAQLLPLLALLPLPALADEVWDTPEGQVVYLEDAKGLAIWQIASDQGELRLYFPGLAGNFDNRSMHEGFWIDSAGTVCGSTLTGPDGHAGTSWGRLIIVFDGPTFASNWTLLRGECFGDPADAPLRGRSPLLP